MYDDFVVKRGFCPPPRALRTLPKKPSRAARGALCPSLQLCHVGTVGVLPLTPLPRTLVHTGSSSTHPPPPIHGFLGAVLTAVPQHMIARPMTGRHW